MMRVVVDPRTDKWDALDQPEDEPKGLELVYVYVAVPGTEVRGHIRARGGMGGFFHGADFRILDPQPDVGHLRTREHFRAWCDDNREMLIAFHKGLKP